MRRTTLFALHFALLLSGAAALLYESVWTRMLHRVFGVGDLAVATVLACFFLGMGLGSAIAGRFSHRIRRPGVVYAALEVAVALYALGSIAMVPAIRSFYVGMGSATSFAELTTVRVLLAAALLLPPTLLMGATLPVLSLLGKSNPSWSRTLTALYATNTVGAAIGAGAAGLWLIPKDGTRISLMMAAVLSAMAAALVMPLLRGVSVMGPPPPTSAEPRTPPIKRPERLSLAIALAALSGFAALASEVLWTRVLRIVLHATTEAFGAMLLNYLLGLALGAVISRRMGAPVRALGILALVQMVLIALAMWMVPQLPRLIPLMHSMPDVVPHSTWVVVVVSMMLLFPIALVTGAGLPLAFRVAEQASDDPASSSGKLLSANTIGGLVGSFTAGFFLVPVLGVEASLLTVAGAYAALGAIALRSDAGTELGPRVLGMTAPFALLVGLVLLRPTIDLPFLLASSRDPMGAALRGPGPSWREDLAFLREGRNTTVTLLRTPVSVVLFNDGRPESGFGQGEPGFGPELVTLGALPGLFASQLDHAMVIGLGAGHSTSVVLSGGFRSVDAIELEPAVVDAARILYEARDKPFPLDRGANLIVDDARNQLVLAEADSLDAVVSQPSHPWLAGSSALYTREFFREVLRALRPGGVLSLWVNTFRMDAPHLRSVVGTLRDVFPHVNAFIVESSSLILIASDQPLDWSERLDERMAHAFSGLGIYQLNTRAALMAHLELDSAGCARFGRDAPRIVDDRPALEFELAHIPNTRGMNIGMLDHAFGEDPWISDPAILSRPEFASWIERRIQEAGGRLRALLRIAPVIQHVAQGEARSFLEGRLAEARGNVNAALAHYDAAGARGAAEADRLRLAENRYVELLQVRSRGTAPTRADHALRAALALGEPQALSRALRIAHASRSDIDDRLEARTASFMELGCEGLIAGLNLEALDGGLESIEFLDRATECAFREGHPEARAIDARAWRARSVASNEATQQAEAAIAGGNGGAAWMHFDRALRLYPSNSGAAAGLALLHQRDRRPALARQVLEAAYKNTEGLGAARARITGVAAQLGVVLETAVDPGNNASSIAPVRPEAPASTTP